MAGESSEFIQALKALLNCLRGVVLVGNRFIQMVRLLQDVL